ncbi:MAG: transglutaminase family protein [Thermodesulfobacteriota bacterium]|nr:transglutaminase family protein [Thermodesulfobacteriota bacterium]
MNSTYYIDSDASAVKDFTARVLYGCNGKDRHKAVALYYAVRDGFPYNPYCFTLEKEKLKASFTLAAGEGFCIQKGILLAAAARAVGIPARLGFGNVINHLATEKLKQLMGTNLFVFHGYTTLFIEGRWVKATPAFNLAMCEKFGTRPLEFDGRTDSVFHPYDARGNLHMEYVHDYGEFDDLPYELMVQELKRHYPVWFSA